MSHIDEHHFVAAFLTRLDNATIAVEFRIACQDSDAQSAVGLLDLAIEVVDLVFFQFAVTEIRGRIDEDRFRKVLLISMVAIGLNLIRRGIF